MSIPMHLNPMLVKRVKLIYVAAMRGDDTEENPTRLAHYYYNDDGELLACHDPINGPPDSFKLPNVELNGAPLAARPSDRRERF